MLWAVTLTDTSWVKMRGREGGRDGREDGRKGGRKGMIAKESAQER